MGGGASGGKRQRPSGRPSGCYKPGSRKHTANTGIAKMKRVLQQLHEENQQLKIANALLAESAEALQKQMQQLLSENNRLKKVFKMPPSFSQL